MWGTLGSSSAAHAAPCGRQGLSTAIPGVSVPPPQKAPASLQQSKCRSFRPQTAASSTPRSNGVGAGAVKRRQKPVVEDVTPSDGEIVPLSSPTGASTRFKDAGPAVVAGAAGGTGKAIVQRLIQEGVPVRALVRNLSAAAAVLPGAENNVELFQGDVYKFSTLPAVLEGSQTLFIATGARPGLDPFGPYNVDYQGTLNLLAAAQQAGVTKLVLISSIGVDDVFFPLNLFFGVVFWKKRAEEAIQRSGIDYTIVRPGGLRDEPPGNEAPGRIVMEGPSSFGLPPGKRSGSILRRQVAEVAVEAAIEPGASRKVVEIITDPTAPLQSLASLFARV
ncbi:hypothetical protein WJX73_007743 [Symbiochloris irregularis]|uniref:NAD(P)-binding domain-containing protein n=1 Tax=Symbiochloris irregularis TaxID=706552 RepID=A0AAW1PED0_9CHLO